MERAGPSSSEYDRRACVVELLRAGRSPSEIINFTGFPRSTVYEIATKYTDAEREGAGSYTPERQMFVRQNTVRTPELIEAVQNKVFEDPSISIRGLAAEFNVVKTTMLRIVHEDLRYKSYVQKVRQLLSDATRNKRLERCHILLSSLKHSAAGRLRFFSDEKIFTVDAKINRRNDRWLAHDPSDVPFVGKTKFPSKIHVLSVVSSEGDIMAPHFFQTGETITKEVYLHVLQTVVEPWMNSVSCGRPYVFQQDGAPAHTSHLVQGWLSEHVSMFWDKDMWPPNSPDLNPLDYYVWGVVERESNKSQHANSESLATAIRRAFDNLSRDVVKKACERFRTRIEKVIAANGGYIQ